MLIWDLIGFNICIHCERILTIELNITIYIMCVYMYIFLCVRTFKFYYLSKFQVHNTVFPLWSPCYTLDAQISFILQLKVCLELFTSLSILFPLPQVPDNHHSASVSSTLFLDSTPR